MSVSLRKRKNADGTTTPYLDIYHEGKRWYEFLKDCKLVKITKPQDRQSNKEKQELANQIAHKRSLELQSSDYNLSPVYKSKIDFLEYYQHYIDHYTKKDKRVLINSLQKFKDYLATQGITSITSKRVTESIVHGFKCYLEDHLNGESPSTYFSRFKKVLKQGTRDKIFPSNPAVDITIKRKESIKKSVLTIEELQLLYNTPLTNIEIKRAFLFCCYSGIRWGDIKELKWRQIDLRNKKVSIIQGKTKKLAEIELHPNALSLLGPTRDDKELVFTLPSHTAVLKNLRNWVKKAGIKKHITYHCSRHTFATNLVFYKADITTTSQLLGHSGLRYTQLYIRVADGLKQEAISNLPAIKL